MRVPHLPSSAQCCFVQLPRASGPSLLVAVEKSVSGARPVSSPFPVGPFLLFSGHRWYGGCHVRVSPPAPRAPAPGAWLCLAGCRGAQVRRQLSNAGGVSPVLTDTEGARRVHVGPQEHGKLAACFSLNFPNFCASFLCLSAGLGSCILLGDCQSLHPLFCHSGMQFVPQEDLGQNMKAFCFVKRRKEKHWLMLGCPC